VTALRCPNCSEPVRPGFRVCPYCAAPLGAALPDLPDIRPAEREGHKDLGGVNAGLIALGALGGIGFLQTFRDGFAGGGWVALGIPFFLAFALTLLARGGPGQAVLNGIGAVVAVFAIGLMIIGALFLCLLTMCSHGCR
jgi:hypothetical protein